MGTPAIGMMWAQVLLAASTPPPETLRVDVGELADAGPLAAPDFGPCAQPGESWAERVERRTRPLVGRPYVTSPLGEGDGPDDDPRLRFDAFDCTTWVETALALATCDGRTLLERLDTIRYQGGRAEFRARRHLVSAQWVPGLEDLGLLERATARAFPEQTERIALRLTPERWVGRRIAKTLELPTEVVPTGTYPVAYVPLDFVRTSSATFAPGTIVNVVRVNWYQSPDVVTHQGLVVRVDDQLFVRHASLRARRVVDEPLREFVRRFSKPRKWPIAGFQLLSPAGVDVGAAQSGEPEFESALERGPELAPAPARDAESESGGGTGATRSGSRSP